jgi:hypothetical protein
MGKNNFNEERGLMINVVFRLIFNYKNKMIFSVKKGCRYVAIILFEDCNRKEAFGDERNLITAKIYILLKKDDTLELRDELQCLAASMIKCKPNVNYKVEFFNDPKVKKYYLVNSDGPTMKFINYMLSLCETKEEVSFSVDDFNHLRQE